MPGDISEHLWGLVKRLVKAATGNQDPWSQPMPSPPKQCPDPPHHCIWQGCLEEAREGCFYIRELRLEPSSQMNGHGQALGPL